MNGTPLTVREAFISLICPELNDGSVVWKGQQGQVEMTFEHAGWSSWTETIETFDHLGEAIVLETKTTPGEAEATYSFCMLCTAI
ncbi:hypothetical protein ACFQZR_01130 [Paenibacillus sp. GCM10027629]|uniref:hypothetical protein n=1 Tax=Paenibacillus sp. GCM10027629 TaxID=3273414 RepID=UPI00362B87FC